MCVCVCVCARVSECGQRSAILCDTSSANNRVAVSELMSSRQSTSMSHVLNSASPSAAVFAMCYKNLECETLLGI